MLSGFSSIEHFWVRTKNNLRYIRSAHHRDFWLFESSVWFHMLAGSMIAVYIPVLMLQAGFVLQEILLFYFIFHLINAPFNIVAGYLTSWIGARRTIILGTIFQIAFFITYGLVEPGSWTVLLLLGALTAIYDALYYVASMYLFMETTEDVNNSGKNTGILYAVIRSASLIGPLIGSAILLLGNGESTWVIISAIAAFTVSLIPLFFTSLEQGHRAVGIPIGDFFNQKYVLANHVSLGLYKIHETIGAVLWPLFIFLYFGSLESVAVLAILVPIVALVFSFISGRINLAYRYYAIAIGALIVACIWIGRLYVENGLWYYASVVVAVLAMIPMQVPIDANIYRSGNETNSLTASVVKNMFSMGTKAVLFGMFYLVAVSYEQSFVVAIVALVVLMMLNVLRIHYKNKNNNF